MDNSGDYISREETLKRLCKDVCNVSDCQCDEIRCLEWYVIHDAPAADVRPRWIPVTERLPEAGERVLCYCRANIYEVMKMRTDGDWAYDTNHVYMHSFVTHWMPLPEPPKEE